MDLGSETELKKIMSFMHLKHQTKMKTMKRIKHNDLTHYFITPHEQLPASYLASCEKFFKGLSAKQKAASIDKKFKSFKRQASSFKLDSD